MPRLAISYCEQSLRSFSVCSSIRPVESLNPRSFILALVQCRHRNEIKRVHAYAITTSMIRNLGVANKLMYIYADHKDLHNASALFSRMDHRDNVSWSVMVGGLAKTGDYLRCLEIFREFVRSGACADNFTIPFVLRVCRDTESVRMGLEIHHLVYKFGLQSDVFVAAALVDMYVKCGFLEDARKVFDKMRTKDLVSWTVMIAGYAECGNPGEALVLFDRMQESGIVPDKVMMVTVAFACAKLGAMHKAKIVHEYIGRRNFSLNVILGTAMIDMYAKCGSVDAAREIFDRMNEKNVITWSSMMSAYGIHGHGRKAIELFPQMLESGIRPNRITFVSILYACSHAGLIDEGRRFFYSMWREYLVEPDVKHYTCMIDLLGRAGRLDEAIELIENTPVEKDEGFWGAFLGACRIHGNIQFAEKAAKALLELCPRNAGYYVLLSNIYAKFSRWEDVAKMRELMTSMRVKKTPGWSWIEINNEIHQFRVGDKNHPRSKEIYEMLKVLSEKLELAGYVPDTNFVLHDVDEELKAAYLYTHSEKLATAYGLLATPEGTTIRIIKNLRVCGDCHTFMKLISAITQREIVFRDANRFHHFKEGSCSCGDYW
ncbi:pentatricopeptide repeat-containing protein At1g11290, chloroplastic-like [Dioscorea cayenensis subsp. rotundata]|uniref:Pentatricopeptide repeat-containing protein At1g11290, chloroplastic-like n=1 Tax=Dioscorea cayennensis subsp. rotundata TaxID=55577 RepID=A0AB40B536_DIOCR|nr:pentatricopeptide repeat-containing protein At1g11290, chloroplastic-like [Dioscorea cayenensis subsp. rotundata]XP_039122375.1 pentatricopeptide repeat-containing protein At1g11290, chloroplastic-like [Dioscorea cayenensis subsp. rotundata]XP_039122376.1 pentatricopeptide repeat-containing protein At1g11290, chloroplastic-like [Dioscorea cayenensis subsp. rotundata]XP_039122377.1 pentatricopeptide repeat-containing protein At1g11290, chloroplastic-like [Dioscorea cayenensis subsp. rotundata]